MYVNEYGSPEDPVVILLAPMMVSGSDLYGLMSPHFEGKYYFIAPDQGGHGKAGDYLSADNEYQQLKMWLIHKGIRKIALIYGASLGVAVGWRLFMDPEFEIGYAWFDGVALCRNARFAEWFMKRMFRSRKKMLAKTQVDASPNLIKMYGYDFAKMMTKNFGRITIWDIDNICRACCHYDLRKLTEEEQRRLHLDFGEKDFDLKYSRKTIPVYMPKAQLQIRKGYAHCGYMAAHTKEYVKEMERAAGGKKMDDKQKSRAYFNSHSSTIINRNGYWSYDYKITSKILMRRGVKNLIDIGCGNGAFLAKFHEADPGAALSGLDLSHEMVEQSRRRLPQADIVEGDAENMPFADGTFDAVSCHMSIHHHPHPERSLSEMHRILEKNGTVLINELTGPAWLRKFMNWWFTKWPTGDHAIYCRAEMEAMLREAGFEHIRSRLITPFTYVCVGHR